MPNTRIEQDSLGELEVPENALYGAQTQRAINNFPISGQAMPEAFIRSLLLIKKAAAQANANLGCLTQSVANAISDACDSLLDSNTLQLHFPVDVYQTGSGTSSNMNANEVIATLASRALGDHVNPNDHVNFGQSSNDVIPTAIHVSAVLQLEEALFPALNHLIEALETKALEVGHHCKTGRTHLMDAMPVTLKQVLDGWRDQLEQDLERLRHAKTQLGQLPLGGTAVGTGINTHPDFADAFSLQLNSLTGQGFTRASNFFSRIGAQDNAVALSGQLRTTAVSIMKIANDLRWMNSGPLAGLGEITLEALQPGSSIMPGKVNPVIPEAAAMVSAKVIGNDTTITLGGQSGNFELNVMLPVIADSLLDSIKLLANVSTLLADRAIATFTINAEQLEKPLAINPILVTALNPVIGYTKAAEIAKAAYREQRPIIDVASEHTDLPREELKALLDPAKLTRGGF
ncbi:class II fumarate hydratase [Marinobacterium marinum]|uniref:Fumarate hydratase class II n=1 Tax=Marinobacterium marinum TaxID=2756129 RepID=A0A7W1WVU9_9GAMM|nr:class II fumarate hydratase [Marinobacterium marinum]MBA4501169.1 class II fumarate hydratase [Marinobacterium marinum]